MIQRIQTLYLLMTTVLPLLFLKLNLLRFVDNDGSELFVRFDGLYSSGADQVLNLTKQLLPISLLILIIPVLSLVTIFLFRNRKLQMKLALIIIILSAGLIVAQVIYSLSITHEFQAKIIPGVIMAVPVLIMIFSFLAYKGIKKDEDLVKSYDRLR